MSDLHTGEFASVWDDGVEIACKCTVDLDEMRIVSFDGERWLDGECDGYDLDSIDDVVENLVEEYVYVYADDGNLTCTAAVDGDDETEDRYGNGILRYDPEML